MIKEVIRDIENGEFKKGYTTYLELTKNQREQLSDEIIDLAFENERIQYLLFFEYLINSQEKNIFNSFWRLVIGVPSYQYIPGIYYLLYEYVKQEINRSPNDLDLQQTLLYFYSFPGYNMSVTEAYCISQNIVKNGYDSDDAKYIINNHDELKKKEKEITKPKEFNFKIFEQIITQDECDFKEAILFAKMLSSDELMTVLIDIGKKNENYGVMIFSQYFDIKTKSKSSSEQVIRVLQEVYSNIPGVSELIEQYKTRKLDFT